MKNVWEENHDVFREQSNLPMETKVTLWLQNDQDSLEVESLGNRVAATYAWPPHCRCKCSPTDKASESDTSLQNTLGTIHVILGLPAVWFERREVKVILIALVLALFIHVINKFLYWARTKYFNMNSRVASAY